jgi:uncharacterized protein YlxP (DUF503 family)
MLPESHSLKEKRMVLRRIKDKLRQKFNLAVAEVADGDAWQSAVLGLAVVANDRRFCEAMVEKAVNYIDTLAKIADDDRDFLQYGDEAMQTEDYTHWEPEEDSPPAGRKKPRAPKVAATAPFPWEAEEEEK